MLVRLTIATALLLLLVGCGSEPPVAKKAISQPSDAPANTAPVTVAPDGKLPNTPTAPAAGGHTLETGEVFEHKETITADQLLSKFTAVAALDAHSSVTAAQIQETVTKMKALKIGENVGGELHTDTPAGHETLRVIVVRKTEKNFELVVQTQTKTLLADIQKRLKA